MHIYCRANEIHVCIMRRERDGGGGDYKILLEFYLLSKSANKIYQRLNKYDLALR